MKVYCLSGLGADHRVFDTLNIQYEKVVIQWVETRLGESMYQYAKKLCNQINGDEPFSLLGVSFGGMLAVEMKKIIRPIKTILVSSVANRKELPLWIRSIGRSQFNKLIPSNWHNSNPNLIYWNFGIKTERGKRIMKHIMKNQDKKFLKHSIDKIVNWQNREPANDIIRIHGTRDHLLPVPKNVDFHALENGGHFAIVENAEQISQLVDQELRDI